MDEVGTKMCQAFTVSFNFQTTLPHTSQRHFANEIGAHRSSMAALRHSN